VTIKNPLGIIHSSTEAVPPALRELIAAAWDQQPDRRPTFEQLLAALRQLDRTSLPTLLREQW
jgi:hypothetical protein